MGYWIFVTSTLHGFGKSIESYYFDERDENGWYSECVVDASTICRCAEIGKEVGISSPIWENEIYQWEDAAYGKCTGIIRYGKYLQDGSGNEYPEVNCYGFYAEVVKVEPYPGLDVSDYPDYLKTISVLEVFIRKSGVTLLGNIFDNPELKVGAEYRCNAECGCHL